MLKTYKINKNKTKIIYKFQKDWKVKKNKVFYFSNLGIFGDDIRKFYKNFFYKVTKFKHFAEDANIKNRNKQRTNSIWMEVRFDPKIKNAYRHSSNPQPLHTDGSYIKTYPSSTLMCCVQNNTKKGETIFISAEEIFKILNSKNKTLLNKILKNDIIHTRSGGTKKSKILYKQNNIWKINWNYYCVDKKKNKKFFSIIEDFKLFLEKKKIIKKKILSIKMQKGDALVWKDDQVLHGRNGFIASNTSDRFIWKCAADFFNK